MALLKGNTAAGNGGAVYVSGSPGRGLAMDRVRATHNSAGGSGGAIFGTGVGMRYSTVADNQSGADGGGIAFSGTGSGGGILWSTVSGNRAASSGGGIHTTVAPASGAAAGVVGFEMRDSTIANNRAGGDGGGIGASGGNSTTELDAVTVARNVAGPGHLGGGLYQGSGDVIRVQNTIVALNLVGAAGTGLDCFGASSGFDSLGYNLIGNADGCSGFGAAGDLFGGRLGLGKLADNGGAKHWTYGRPLQTIALGRGSRAIDQGLSISASDERGVDRGTKQDIGAYERVVKSYRLINRADRSAARGPTRSARSRRRISGKGAVSASHRRSQCRHERVKPPLSMQADSCFSSKAVLLSRSMRRRPTPTFTRKRKSRQACVHRCAQRPGSALVASASASAFHFRGIHEILMLGNSWSREHASACRGLMCSLPTFAQPFTWSTTSSESRNTRMRWIPRLRASLSPSMRARYSATVLMAGPIGLEISSIS